MMIVVITKARVVVAVEPIIPIQLVLLQPPAIGVTLFGGFREQQIRPK